MLARLRAWRAERRRKEGAIRRAVQEFRESRGFAPMGAHVLRLDPKKPSCAWCIWPITYLPIAPGSPYRIQPELFASSRSRTLQTWNRPGA